jgi:hypothetical protein
MYPLNFFRPASTVAVFAMLAVCSGCQKKPAPVAVPDVAAAQLEAQQEVAKAKLEAKRGVNSAVKIGGPDSSDVARAKITGAFDIAMTRAEGNRKVADEKCLTLEQSAQQSCKEKAEADYQAAMAQAKAKRDEQLR